MLRRRDSMNNRRVSRGNRRGYFMRISNLTLCAWLLAQGLLPLSAWAAKPVLLLHPTIVMLEGRTRAATINVVNRGDARGTFVVSWVDFAMTPEGGLRKLEQPPSWTLQPHVRYSPRRMTLDPGETQLVKIALRRSLDVSEGEYYSHFKVLTLSSEAVDDPVAMDNTGPARSVNIVARSAMAIPVIWRNTSAEPRAAIESVVFDPEDNLEVKELLVGVRRFGDASVRGFLHVIRYGQGDIEIPVADPVPVVIYPSLDVRTVPVRLQAGFFADDLKKGVTIIYASSLDIDDKEARLASFRY